MDVVFPKSGKYVVAVSGGVDSVALLHILTQRPDLELVVAHLDHGIRSDSAKDRKLVQGLAKDYQLPFVYEEVELGPDASEAVARDFRYQFLRRTASQNSAKAIITAHHQDDLLETAILNMLRGTGRKGLSSLKSNAEVLRPLLKIPKEDLIKYAKVNDLKWREDSTNNDIAYLRNYVRHNILPKFSGADKLRLINLVTSMEATNNETDELLVQVMKSQIIDGQVDRRWFNQLPHNLAKEFMASWLRSLGVRDFDSNTLERLVVGAKTATTGKRIEAVKGFQLAVNKDNLALKGPER